MTEEERQDFHSVFSCLAGCTIRETRAVKAADVGRVTKALVSALYDTDVPLVKKFKHEGVTYGMEPDLNNINIGMMADLCSHLDNPDSWNKALAVLYRPVIAETRKMGGLYRIAPHDIDQAYRDRCEVMKQVPSSIFLGVRAFFLNGSKALNKFTSDSLKPKLSKVTPKQ